MALTAQALENAAAPLIYRALSDRGTLLCLVAVYAAPTGLTAQTAMTAAAANSYRALSDHDLDLAILEVI
jgi:hypothetical protein